MIELYTQDTRIRRLVEQACAGVCEVEVHSLPRKEVMAGSFDLVATAGGLNPGLERFAAQFGAMPLVLPEGGEWLGSKGQRDHVAILGSDYRDVKF